MEDKSYFSFNEGRNGKRRLIFYCMKQEMVKEGLYLLCEAINGKKKAYFFNYKCSYM